MGHGELTAVVDAGPLIHLFEIGCLQLLNRFDALYLPDSVWGETVGRDRVSKAGVSVLNNIQRHPIDAPEVEQFIREKNLSALHSSDQECLFVCLEQQIPLPSRPATSGIGHLTPAFFPLCVKARKSFDYLRMSPSP